ncbi:MAG TPA: hypothetical protein VKV26_16295 [Dehalococcoidia bacterium]|nr:hypothetical protein [Dehalococcoidia bacterium]
MPAGRANNAYADAEQPALLRRLRQYSRESDYVRWEALRGELTGMGYRVVLVRGVEHLRPLGG